jgi:hypothetical protein
MSTATDSTATIPTRRAFLLRSAPVAAAVVMVGGATAVEAAVALPVEPIPAAPADPIFALIEQHRAALHEEKRTHDIFEQHADDPREHHDRRGVVVGEKPVRSVEIVRQDEEVIHFNYPLRGKMEPIIVFIPKMIANYVPKDLDEVEREAWIKDKRKELRRNRRACDRRNKKNTPRNVAYKAWTEASTVKDALSKQLIETAPTTVAGVAAVLAHWSEVMDEEEHDRDFISTGELLKNLAKGVKAIG